MFHFLCLFDFESDFPLFCFNFLQNSGFLALLATNSSGNTKTDQLNQLVVDFSVLKLVNWDYGCAVQKPRINLQIRNYQLKILVLNCIQNDQDLYASKLKIQLNMKSVRILWRPNLESAAPLFQQLQLQKNRT
ncbi:Hypothetical_protein [Hexamita inflata]|uniref:Hypothetical_protein n=1 Tax=Hexamita inflata TaxID=28002 RepID=A0AA86QV05_9EUKA|nr:Hypothetical protein HINF_LOCUS47798 [Hexamita inflata]